MKKQLLTGAVVFGTVAIGSLLQADPAEAMMFTCGNASYADNVDATGVAVNLGCDLGTVNNDKINPFQVNEDQLFGFSDWQFQGKDAESIDISNAFPAYNTLTGDYNLNSFVKDSWTNIMLVLKGGQGNINPENYVGYLVAQDNTGNWTGTWTTPFMNKQGNDADVSHISLYYREGTTTEIPTPALLPGLIGMSVASLRKKKKQVAEIA